MKQPNNPMAPSPHGPLLRALCALCAWVVVGAWPDAGASHARAAGPPIAVVVSVDNEVESLSLASLRSCFLGRSVSVAGVRLIPFNHPVNDPLRVRLDETVLGMSTLASQRYWIDSRIRGDARAPRTVTDLRLLGKVVAKLPGAISYLEASTLPMFPELKAVEIDGKHPGEPGYPLR